MGHRRSTLTVLNTRERERERGGAQTTWTDLNLRFIPSAQSPAFWNHQLLCWMHHQTFLRHKVPLALWLWHFSCVAWSSIMRLTVAASHPHLILAFKGSFKYFPANAQIVELSGRALQCVNSNRWCNKARHGIRFVIDSAGQVHPAPPGGSQSKALPLVEMLRLVRVDTLPG